MVSSFMNKHLLGFQYEVVTLLSFFSDKCTKPFTWESFRSSAFSYSMARFWLRRNFNKLGNLSVLSTVLWSELTNFAHSFLTSVDNFFSITLTELVVVISFSRPNLFKFR